MDVLKIEHFEVLQQPNFTINPATVSVTTRQDQRSYKMTLVGYSRSYELHNVSLPLLCWGGGINIYFLCSEAEHVAADHARNHGCGCLDRNLRQNSRLQQGLNFTMCTHPTLLFENRPCEIF